MKDNMLTGGIMDIIVMLFSVFLLAAVFLGLLSIIGIVVEHVTKQEQECFDDVEGIKRVFKQEDK